MVRKYAPLSSENLAHSVEQLRLVVWDDEHYESVTDVSEKKAALLQPFA
jgi:hypothetical protein